MYVQNYSLSIFTIEIIYERRNFISVASKTLMYVDPLKVAYFIVLKFGEGKIGAA